MSGSLRDTFKKPFEAVEKKIQKSGKSGKYDIFSIPALKSVKADNSRMEEARLTGDLASVADIAEQVPPGMADFTGLFEAGFTHKLDAICGQIADSIKLMQKQHTEQGSDEDPQILFVQAAPRSVIALANFKVTIISAKSTWSEITTNPRYMMQQQKEFRSVAEACIADCYKKVDAKAQAAIKVLKDCTVTIAKGGADSPQAEGKIKEANKALEQLNDEIGSQISECQKKIELKCSDSLSAVITAEIKASKEIIATRGKKARLRRRGRRPHRRPRRARRRQHGGHGRARDRRHHPRRGQHGSDDQGFAPSISTCSGWRSTSIFRS